MLTKVTDTALANNVRALRNQMRPLMDELRRRGYTITEVHGHKRVSVTGFENITISRRKVEKL